MIIKEAWKYEGEGFFQVYTDVKTAYMVALDSVKGFFLVEEDGE